MVGFAADLCMLVLALPLLPPFTRLRLAARVPGWREQRDWDFGRLLKYGSARR
jgi:hypothetical protein